MHTIASLTGTTTRRGNWRAAISLLKLGLLAIVAVLLATKALLGRRIVGPLGHSGSPVFSRNWHIAFPRFGSQMLQMECAYRKSHSAVFAQCNIVALRSKLAAISIRGDT